MHKKTVSRFTLIEMLSVIAIIAVLASLLVPVSVKARAKAGQISCVGNLKQLDISFMLYASDHRERLMPYITGGGVYDHPGTNWTRITYPYYQSIEVLACPASMQDGPEPTKIGFHLYDGNYGWNYDGTQGNRGRLHSHIEFPSKGYLLFDSGDQCVIYGKNCWDNLMEELDLDWDSRSEGCNRHLDNVNIAFVDGHVEARGLPEFLAAPCQTNAPPWYIEWDGGQLTAGCVPYPKR